MMSQFSRRVQAERPRAVFPAPGLDIIGMIESVRRCLAPGRQEGQRGNVTEALIGIWVGANPTIGSAARQSATAAASLNGSWVRYCVKPGPFIHGTVSCSRRMTGMREW